MAGILLRYLIRNDMEDPEVPTEHLHEEIHHHAEHSRERWVLGVALSSALLAGLAAVSSLMAGHHANEAMMSQIESTDQWRYYQSKGIKETALTSKAEILDALGKAGLRRRQRESGEYRAGQRADREKGRRSGEGCSNPSAHPRGFGEQRDDVPDRHRGRSDCGPDPKSSDSGWPVWVLVLVGIAFLIQSFFTAGMATIGSLIEPGASVVSCRLSGAVGGCRPECNLTSPWISLAGKKPPSASHVPPRQRKDLGR